MRINRWKNNQYFWKRKIWYGKERNNETIRIENSIRKRNQWKENDCKHQNKKNRPNIRSRKRLSKKQIAK